LNGSNPQEDAPGTLLRERSPYSTKREELELEAAMDMIADRVRDTRERTFVERLFPKHTLKALAAR